MPKTRKDEDQPQVESQDAATTEVADLATLESKLAELKQQAAELEAQAEAAKPATPTDSTPLPVDRLASQAEDEEVARAEVVRDPFDATNALKILMDPPGKKLRWLSLAYREGKGMKGWTPVERDDAIGRELHRYIAEPPARMVGSADMDNIVRRGDVFLAWIDRGIWQARQNKRVSEAHRRISPHVSATQERYGNHAMTTDAGLKRDSNPYQESRVAPGFVSRDQLDYRARAKGTTDDPRIRTSGRNMFEEAPEEE